MQVNIITNQPYIIPVPRSFSTYTLLKHDCFFFFYQYNIADSELAKHFKASRSVIIFDK